jgi:hypothetical protein
VSVRRSLSRILGSYQDLSRSSAKVANAFAAVARPGAAFSHMVDS